MPWIGKADALGRQGRFLAAGRKPYDLGPDPDAPVVLSRAVTSASGADAATFTVNLPELTVGRHLLVILTSSVDWTTVTGWGLASSSTHTEAGNLYHSVFFRPIPASNVVDGVPVSFTVNLAAPGQCAAVAMCIDAGDHPGVYFDTVTEGTAADAASPASDLLAARNMLWVVARSGFSPVTAPPPGYTNLQVATGSVTASTAERTVKDSQAESPGAWTAESGAWFNRTIGIWADREPLAKWKAAVADPSRNALCLCIGDSATSGANPDMANDQQAIAYPAILAAGFAKCPARVANFYSDNGAYGAASTAPAYDSRLVFVGDVVHTASASLYSAGGGVFSLTNASDRIEFTPEKPFDRAKVLYATYAGSPGLQVKEGRTVLGTLDQDDATNALKATTFELTDNTHTLTFTGAANAFLNGAITWRSTEKAAIFVNLGWYGSKVGDWMDASTGSTPFNAVMSLAGDLNIIKLGGNDKLQGTDRETFKSQLRALALAALKSGSVIIHTAHIFDTTTTGISLGTQFAFNTDMQTVATELNCFFFNLRSYPGWNTYTSANSAGFISSDHVHPSTAGYANEAACLLQVI